ncbi:MAG: DEAD/DEAH box helicase [Spirochaetales bacterium]|nr:DEAD/DEAH box helicase [Spirochaetales bacterium]
MYCIHGTWIPSGNKEFINNGNFCIWVEKEPQQTKIKPGQKDVHPFHLSPDELHSFFFEGLKIKDLSLNNENNYRKNYFLLPTENKSPLLSFDMLRYLGEELPDTYDVAQWQISCFTPDNPLRFLKELHFISLYYPHELMLGHDLLFWIHYGTAWKDIILKDHYIPALKYHEREKSSKKKKVNTTGSFRMYPGWEIISHRYGELLEEYSTSMPFFCTCGDDTKNIEITHYNPGTLLQHFSEQMMDDLVKKTGFTQKLIKDVSNTFIEKCMDYNTKGEQYDNHDNRLVETWKKWYVWKKYLDDVTTEIPFNVCFRVHSAAPDKPDIWKIEFLIESKKDPSLKIALSNYWCNEKNKIIHSFLGIDFEKELLLKLGFAARIYPKIWEGLETDTPKDVMLRRDEAFTFLKESAWVLEDAGFKIIVPSWWTPEGRKKARIRIKAEGSTPKQGMNRGYFTLPSLIHYNYELSIGGEPVTEKEWQLLINAKSPLIHFRGEWMELDRNKMSQMLEFWKKHNKEQADISIIDLIKKTAENSDEFDFSYDETLVEMMERLLAKSRFIILDKVEGFNGALRTYQKRGTSWLLYLESLGLHPCLADDMGLGKTIEIIALLIFEKKQKGNKGPTLLIVPTSVIGNWEKEIERFAPELKTIIHHGSDRMKLANDFQTESCNNDVVITSFTLTRKDTALLQEIEWHRIVVDEAQNIKNPISAQTKAIVKLKASHRIALTGTPIENRLLDLWSIFHFLNPGYLSTPSKFRKQYEIPIQKENDLPKQMILKKLVEPFILRRVKTDKEIISDLPDKVEQTLFCNLTKEQTSLYQAVVDEVSTSIEKTDGIQRKGLILSTLMKLKQICNHPRQFLQDGSIFSRERSHKLTRLTEMVDEVIQNEESLLIFTQFKDIGSSLEQYFKSEFHYNTYFLHGGTTRKKREKMIEDFQAPDTDPGVFILSLKAGGVGITLTKANHVFHFDRWWNPAVENQATDRAFRIGQKKNVFVHKFVAIGTLEEQIDKMLADKQKLSETIVGSDESWLSTLDNETFKNLIRLQKSSILE